MKRLIGCATVLFVVGLLSIGDVATAKPREKKADKAETAGAAKVVKAVEAKKPEENKEEAAKPAAETKPAETKPAETKPAPTKPAPTKPAPAKPAAPPKPAVHTVKPTLVKVEVKLKGIFEAKKMAPIATNPKEWKTLYVKDVLKHGTQVDKGDVLIRFDAEKLDEAIADHRVSLRLAELGLKQAEASLEAFESVAPMDLDLVERTQREADEDYQRYVDIIRPSNVKSAEFSLRSYEEMLEYEQEELRQLEKMYEADDLTEETEEIILKRQRSAVERAEFYLDLAKRRHEESLEINFPRQDIAMRNRNIRQEFVTRQAKVNLPSLLVQRRLELEKTKVSHTRSEQRLEKLLKDQENMTIRSPIDGTVYYGECVRGVWSSDTVADGDKVTPDDVFMTVVQTDSMVVRVTISENELRWFRRGLKGFLQVTAYPDLEIDCTMDQIDRVPLSAGKFSATLKVRGRDEIDMLAPGMTGTAKFVPYLRERALTVPSKAVFTDELNSRKRFVYMASKDGEPKKQTVKIGQPSGENLEILEGLVAGDEVLLERPKDTK